MQSQTWSLFVTGSLPPSGKADRVVFKVNVELEKLEARLQYESSSAPPLALLSVEAVAVDLTVRPDTLTATASLGNLRAQDGVLPEVCRPANNLGLSLLLVLCYELKHLHLRSKHVRELELFMDVSRLCHIQQCQLFRSQ